VFQAYQVRGCKIDVNMDILISSMIYNLFLIRISDVSSP
jgi:hypothetical protein